MQLKLMKIHNALTSIEDLRVYHYWRPRLKAPFCVWAEDSEGDSLHTGNHKTEQVIDGTIDYFTLKEFDINVDLIQEALNSVDTLGWQLNSIQYEEDTNLIHYEWSFSIA